MFGYRLIKNGEIETLKSQLADAQKIVEEQTEKIAMLEKKVKKQEEEPNVPMGEHCNCPYECWYIKYCERM